MGYQAIFGPDGKIASSSNSIPKFGMAVHPGSNRRTRRAAMSALKKDRKKSHKRVIVVNPE